MVEMELVDVRVDQATNNPVALLRTTDESVERRLLPIFIGVTEAQAIRIGLDGRATPRPMTHDLLGAVVEACGATLTRVLVTELRENIFYAELHLDRGGEAVIVSSRPSDAFALAVRIGAPIFAADELVAEHAIADPEAEVDGDPDELVDEFRQFLDEINPDDFKS
jgi:uncharacterized protein